MDIKKVRFEIFMGKKDGTLVIEADKPLEKAFDLLKNVNVNKKYMDEYSFELVEKTLWYSGKHEINGIDYMHFPKGNKYNEYRETGTDLEMIETDTILAYNYYNENGCGIDQLFFFIKINNWTEEQRNNSYIIINGKRINLIEQLAMWSMLKSNNRVMPIDNILVISYFKKNHNIPWCIEIDNIGIEEGTDLEKLEKSMNDTSYIDSLKEINI